MFLLSLILPTDIVVAELVKKEHKWSVPPEADIVLDVAVTGFMVWHGAWFLGTLYCLHIFFYTAARGKMAELRNKLVDEKELAAV